MTSCEAKTIIGFRCGRDSTNQSYFWFYDQHQRINRVFHLCQDHSNEILGELIQKEIGYNHLIDKLKKKIEHIKQMKTKSLNYSEQREAIRNAKDNGVAPPKFPNLKKLDDDIAEVYRKIRVYYDIRNIERNKTCRYYNCQYPLKEPNEPMDQIGTAYSHADFHSGNGYRREAIMFHTECAITWLMSKVILSEKELGYVKPRLSGQETLIDT